MLQCLNMEELKPTPIATHYRAFCTIGWQWLQPLNAVRFQTHKDHFFSAVQWCNDKDISVIKKDIGYFSDGTDYHSIMFTNEEDYLAFTLAYGDLYYGNTKIEKY